MIQARLARPETCTSLPPQIPASAAAGSPQICAQQQWETETSHRFFINAINATRDLGCFAHCPALQRHFRVVFPLHIFGRPLPPMPQDFLGFSSLIPFELSVCFALCMNFSLCLPYLGNLAAWRPDSAFEFRRASNITSSLARLRNRS